MAVSDQQFLDDIDSALQAIIQGGVQALNSSARGLTRLSVKELMDLKKDFETRVSRASNGGFHVAQFRTPE